jgi:hypothetical protein
LETALKKHEARLKNGKSGHFGQMKKNHVASSYPSRKRRIGQQTEISKKEERLNLCFYFKIFDFAGQIGGYFSTSGRGKHHIDVGFKHVWPAKK